MLELQFIHKILRKRIEIFFAYLFEINNNKIKN